MTTTIESQQLPAITEAQRGAALEALSLPDVSALDLEKADAESLATMYYSLQRQLATANALFDSACQPIREAMTAAYHRVAEATDAAGGNKLPHAALNVYFVQGYIDQKLLDILLELKDHLKPDEFKAAIMFKGVDVKDNPKAAEAAIAAGAKPIYEPHAGVLRRLISEKNYGPDGVVGKIIERGLKRVTHGPRRLVIEPNESAIKAISQ
jgi:hypothetical protein